MAFGLGTKEPPTAAPKEKKVKTERQKFVDWARANRPALLNADGKLKEEPPADCFVKANNVKPPTKRDFAEDMVYTAWAIKQQMAKIEVQQKRLTRKQEQHNMLMQHGGDPERAKKERRKLKLEEELARLKADLAAGVQRPA